MKKYLLEMTDAEHKTIKRRALMAGVTMKKYIIDMLLDGKINHKKPK